MTEPLDFTAVRERLAELDRVLNLDASAEQWRSTVTVTALACVRDVEPLLAAVERLTAERDEFAARNSMSIAKADARRRDLEYVRSTLDRVRELHGRPRTERHGSGCVSCGIAWPCPTKLAVDAYAAQTPGVDTGTSEARTAAHGDAGPADGAVAAESDPLAEAIAAYFGGFVQEEGATYRHNDFAEGLIESLADAGWNIDAIGHPNTWALPAEPGPEVAAVRGSDGVRWVRAVRNAPGWRRDRGGSITVSWQTMLRDAAPLTDATRETP